MATSCTGGIYRLVFHEGGVYIGSTNNFARRFRDHRRDLEQGKHKNFALQKAFAKYGDYQEERLLICEPDMLLQYEQAYLDVIKPRYNLSAIAGKIEMTPEVRAKIGASNLGHERYKCPETRKKLSAASKGRKVSPETRAKLRASVTGFRHTDEAKQKISVAHAGRALSPEHRAKTGAGLRGKPKSDDHRAALRLAWVGRKARLEAANAAGVL